MGGQNWTVWLQCEEELDGGERYHDSEPDPVCMGHPLTESEAARVMEHMLDAGQQWLRMNKPELVDEGLIP